MINSCRTAELVNRIFAQVVKVSQTAQPQHTINRPITPLIVDCRDVTELIKIRIRRMRILMYKSVRMRMLLKIKIQHDKHVQHIIDLYQFKLLSL